MRLLNIIIKNIKREPTIFLLFLIISGVSVSLVWWVSKDNTPPHWDMSNHLMNALSYSDGIAGRLKSGGLGPLKAVKFLLTHYFYYPPLLYLISIPIAAFSRNYHSLILVNILFIFIFGFSVYFITKEYSDKWIALVSAIVAVTLPILLSQSQQYQLDFPLTAIVTLGLLFLIKSRYFSNNLFSFLFGVTAGLGMLLKWPVLAFLAPASCYYLIVGVTRNGFKKTLRPLLYAIIPFVLIIAPWFLYNIKIIKSDLGVNVATGIAEGDPPILTKASFLWYLRVFPFEYIRGLYLPFLFVGIIYSFITLIKKESSRFLLITILGSYIIMTLFRNKDYRFIMPISGIAVVMMTSWIRDIPKLWRNIILGYLVIASIFIFVALRFGIKQIPRDFIILKTEATGSIPLYRQTGYFSDQPHSELWPNKTILQTLAAIKDTKYPGVGIIAMDYYDEPYFNKENFKYYILADKLQLSISYPYPPNDTLDCTRDDFLVVTETNKGPAKFVFDNGVYFDQKNNVYCSRELLRKDQLPDNETVMTYRISKPTNN